ncbi:Bacteriophage protein [Mycobacteroides abscessus subsp. abscessus]|uniref:HNH endonuclease signature motif containing protein n=1 Tax=Mycobacteroides abscessus TaxID=36809 RepID=UPI00092598C6|nr:Bacteriophage protein [Mycobacteroides abscessus subsp. abscessus]
MSRAPKVCGHRDCTTLVHGGGNRCPTHKTHGWGKGTNRRTSTPEHQAWSKAVRTRDGRCMINRPGCTGGADTADHKRPVKFGGAQFDLSNGQAACWSCHGWKSSREGNQAQGHRVRGDE